MKPKSLVPYGISAVRLAALPLFLYFYSLGASFLCLIVFGLAAVSDLIDGYVARKLGVASKTGAYFDAVTDFALILGIFGAFTLSGVYPVWLLLLIVGSFAQFVVTGYFGRRLYDPLGKYIGSVLYIGIALTLLSPAALTLIVVQAGVFAFTVTSFVTRMLSLAGITDKHFLAAKAVIEPPNPKTAAKKP